MKAEDRKKIEKIMAGMKCPKDFKCAENGFERLCDAEDTGIKSFLKCLEKNSSSCSFRLFYGLSFYCGCPLRVYLSKELMK